MTAWKINHNLTGVCVFRIAVTEGAGVTLEQQAALSTLGEKVQYGLN